MFIINSFFTISIDKRGLNCLKHKKTAINEEIINCSFINVARPGIEPGSKV